MLFKNGKIYKIISEENKECFISYCTDKTLKQILKGHQKDYKNYHTKGFNKRYCTSYKIIDSDDHEIVLIEDYPCDSEDDLRKRAYYWMHQLNCVNKVK